jgi:hypothetical protein
VVNYLGERSNESCDEWGEVMVKGLVRAQGKALVEEETENDEQQRT